MSLSAGSVRPLAALASGPLSGRIRIPGDRSISHRALMLGSLAIGETVIEGLPEGPDILSTIAALRAFGATVTRQTPGRWTVNGVGVGGLLEPEDVIDFGNAGIGVRLVLGLAANQATTVTLTGDVLLRRRPMGRILDPLRRMGVQVLARSRDRLPLTLKGPDVALPIDYRVPVALAQVKSAVLLAALNAPGVTRLVEPVPTRDHTERMLAHFGATVLVEPEGAHGRRITLTGQPELVPAPIMVPADPSSAAFPLVAVLLVPGSELILTDTLLNPLRTGLTTTLAEMGASIEILGVRGEGGEELADLCVRACALHGVEVPAARAPAMIDEYPILAVAAAFAEGTTVMRGLKELRVKESDRLAATAAMLRVNGVDVEIDGDDLIVHGRGGVPGGALVATHMDHRIAMSALVMGLASEHPIAVDDGSFIATSFPGFVAAMRALGGDLG